MKAMNLCDQYKQELQMLDAEIAQLQYKCSCFVVAQECFHRCIQNGVGVCNPMSLDTFHQKLMEDVDRCFRHFDETVFTEQLALFGLYLIQHEKCIRNQHVSAQLWLGKLYEEDPDRLPD